MQNRYRRLPLVAIVLLWAVGGVAEPALAVTFTEFSLPTAGGPNGITVGPDGALWFTETGGNKIGRITTTRAISEFPIPTADSSPLTLRQGRTARCGSSRLLAASGALPPTE